jgi:protein-disulfide isomerase
MNFPMLSQTPSKMTALKKTALSLLMTGAFFGMSQTVWAQQTPLPKDQAKSEDTESDTAMDTDKAAPEVEFATTEAPDDHVLGSDIAPITMIMYASVTCGHCGTWFQNEWDAVKKNLIEPEKIRFILRAIPTPPEQMSVVGFLIAECAPAEDYFKVIEYQMNKQKEMFDQARAGGLQAAYAKVGELAGLKDVEAIRTCLADPKMMDHLRLSGERGNAADISGVPAFFVNGEAYKGKQDAETLTELFDQMIKDGVSKLPEVEPYDPHAHHDHSKNSH